MKVIILGAGQVGGALAETLSMEQHDVTLVDVIDEQLQEYSERLDIRTVSGRCSYPDVLRQAGANEADVIIAVTDSDETNMVACQVAYSLFHIPTKIARIRSPHYFIRKELFGQDNLPIDVFINPEQLLTNAISRAIQFPGTLDVVNFAEDQLQLIIVKADRNGSVTGDTLEKFYTKLPNRKAKLIAIHRHGQYIILRDKTIIRPNDECYILTLRDEINPLIKLLRDAPDTCKSIMIAGAGHVGRRLAEELQHDYRIKIIDHNRKNCEMVSEKCDNSVTVLCGEASDANLLNNENIEHIDWFIAVTNDDEANILASIQAKKLGAHSVMSLINRTAYVDLIEGDTIDLVISPQYATISSTLTHIRQGDIASVTTLRRGAAEIIEGIVHGDHRTSNLVGKRLNQLKLPSTVQIGAIIREGIPILTQENIQIEAEDHLILLVTDKSNVNLVEKLFRVGPRFF